MQCAYKGPFPLPFKGKGDDSEWRMKTLQRRLASAEEACREIERDIRALIRHFEQTFTATLPASLALHNTGNGKYVRWRMAGSQQRYFTLYQNETGEQFLQPLSPPVRQVIMDFEKQRLRINLLYGLHHYESKMLQRFLNEQAALNALIKSG